MTTKDLQTFLTILDLDTQLSRLSEALRIIQGQLDAAVIQRAKLSGDTKYLAFEVRQSKVVIRPCVLAKLQPPPKPQKRIEITPVHVPVTINGQALVMGAGDHIALLTGTQERFEQARIWTDREQVLETI